jgi:uncharacterized protein YqjF (DUF2071 family)
MKPAFLTAQWRKLAIANYAVDPELLLPYLPYKTELDLWKGKCYVSLVGFMFLNTKLKGVPVPFHQNFEEVNLRFYVRYKDGVQWKRGVTFIKEIVPRRALTFIANTIYNEKYETLPMKHDWDINEQYISVAYSWKSAGRWNTFSVTTDPVSIDILPGSEEEFITEHYWGYTSQNEFMCSEYGVEHPIWKMYKVNRHVIDVSFAEVYGEQFAFLNSLQPDSIMLAEGSDIVVRTMKKIV